MLFAMPARATSVIASCARLRYLMNIHSARLAPPTRTNTVRPRLRGSCGTKPYRNCDDATTLAAMVIHPA